MYSLPSRWSSSCWSARPSRPEPATLTFLPVPVLGDDPDLLVARDVRDVARDREAALEVAVVAVGAHDLRVDELVELVLDLDRRTRGAARRAGAPRGRRRARARIVSVRSSSSSWRDLPKLSTVSPFSRSRGSPSMTMGRTLMAAEYRRRPRPARRGRLVGRRSAAASTWSAADSAASRRGLGRVLGRVRDVAAASSPSAPSGRARRSVAPSASARSSAATDWAFSANRCPYSVVTSAAFCAIGPAFDGGDGGELGGLRADLARRPAPPAWRCPGSSSGAGASHSLAAAPASAAARRRVARVAGVGGSGSSARDSPPRCVGSFVWSVIGDSSSADGIASRAPLSPVDGRFVHVPIGRTAARVAVRADSRGRRPRDHGAPGGGSSSATGSAPAQDDVEPPPVAAPRDVRGRRPGDLDAAGLARGRAPAGGRPSPSASRSAASRSASADGELDQAPERRRPEPLPERQLLVVERGRVALDDGADRAVVGPVGLDERAARPVAAARPARPPARAAGTSAPTARSSGRLSAMSADTTPTSVTSGTSRPLATRLVPTRTSRPPAGERVEHPVGGALALDDVAVEAADAQGREPLPDLALDALRAAAEVPDPRRRARRAAGRDRPGAAAVVAAQRRARRGGRRAAGRSPGRPGRGRSRGTATTDAVPRRLMTRIARSPRRRVERRRARPRARRESSPRLPAASSARRSTARHARLGAGRPRRAARRAGTARRARGPSLSTDGVALPRTTAAPASRAELERRVARLEARRPVALVGGVVLLVDDDRGRRPRAAPAARSASRRRRPRRPPGSGATRRRARPRRGPSGGSRSGPARSARSRSTIGVARAISGTSRSAGRPAASDGGDRLDVDRGLAAAGDAVEQDGRRVARRDGRRARVAAPSPGRRSAPTPPAGRRGRRRAGRRAAGAGARGPPRGRGRAGRGRRSPTRRGARRAAPAADGRRPAAAGAPSRRAGADAPSSAACWRGPERPPGRALRPRRAPRPPPRPSAVSHSRRS